MFDPEKAEGFNDTVVDLLNQILENQEAQKEAFEEFREDVLEKLDNLSLPGGDFRYEST